jgi:hypothetical protein
MCYEFSSGVLFYYCGPPAVILGVLIKRVFITNVKGTFLGMSESEEASKRR